MGLGLLALGPVPPPWHSLPSPTPGQLAFLPVWPVEGGDGIIWGLTVSDSSPGGGCIFSRLLQVGTADLDQPGLQEITALHSSVMDVKACLSRVQFCALTPCFQSCSDGRLLVRPSLNQVPPMMTPFPQCPLSPICLVGGVGPTITICSWSLFIL